MCDFDKEFINVSFDKKLQSEDLTNECFIDYTEYKLRYTIETYKRREAYNKLCADIDVPQPVGNDVLFRYANNTLKVRQRKDLLLKQRAALENFLDYISKIGDVDLKYKEKRVLKRHST